MNAVSLLCEIITQTGKVAASAHRDDPRYSALLNAGLLQRDGLVQSVLCENCDAQHDAEIIFEDGSYGHFCPELGFVPVERTDLFAVSPNPAALVDQLSVAFECEPGGTSQLGPRTWRVGLVDTPRGRAVVHFHTCLLNDIDLVDLKTALRAEIRRDYALIVTATGRLSYHQAVICNLAQMVQLELGSASIRKLVSVAEAVGAPPKPTGGRPSVYRERLQGLLADRAAPGVAETGRNQAAEAVLGVYVMRYPNDPAPSRATVQRYVSEFRTGS